MSTLNYPVSSLDQQSLPAVKTLVYSLTMKALLFAEEQSALEGTVFQWKKTEAKIQARSLKRNEGKIPTNKVNTLAYISDWLVLVMTENNACAQTCKRTEPIPTEAGFYKS